MSNKLANVVNNLILNTKNGRITWEPSIKGNGLRCVINDKIIRLIYKPDQTLNIEFFNNKQESYAVENSSNLPVLKDLYTEAEQSVEMVSNYQFDELLQDMSNLSNNKG
jgi:hypothetical protein